jgi:hypothetical protein
MCSKDSKVTYCAEEIRIGRKYADVFIQTDLGPFYIEVIDSHPPESTRWEELEHRIIPFWIDRFREQDADGFEFMVHHDFGEIFSMHFGMICDKVNQLRRGGSIEETWFKHMERILSAVEDIHRDAKSNPPWYGGNDFVTTFVYAKNHPDYDKIVSGYKAASRRLLSR